MTGPVGGQRDDPKCSANCTPTVESPIIYVNVTDLQDEHACPSPIKSGRLDKRSDDDDDSGQVPNEKFTDELAGQKDANSLLFSKGECKIRD